MKKLLKLMLKGLVIISSFIIKSNGFNLVPPLENCLAEYKEAYKEFEPEAKYAMVEVKANHQQGTIVSTYRYSTTADVNKLNRYVKALGELNNKLSIRILIKGALFGIGCGVITRVLKDSVLDRVWLTALLSIGGSLAITRQENRIIGTEISYFDPLTLKKEENLCSNTNLVKVLKKSTISLLAATSTFIVSKYLLDHV